MNYIVKKIEKSDWRQYRDIRLEALMNEPAAFGSSYSAESQRTDEQWQERMIEAEKINGDRFFYGVFDGSILVSIGGAYKNDSAEWNIIAIYTKKEFRGQGIGKLLMSGLLNDLRRREIKKVFLCVNTIQESAVALYKKTGFKITKTIQNELMGDGKYYDEHEMAIEL